MVQAQHTQLVAMVVPVHMALAMVHQLQAAMALVHMVVLVLMVDMVPLAIDKSHCGTFDGGMFLTLLTPVLMMLQMLNLRDLTVNDSLIYN